MPIIELKVDSGDPLSVRRFVVREAVSEPFEITIAARSADPSLDLDSIVGRRATFRLVTGMAGAQEKERRWTGIVRFAEQEQAEPSGLSTYRLVLVPALWLLTQRRDHRIVQHRSAPAIAAGLLDLWRIPYERGLKATHPPLPYKVQYGETDYAFFCRILEEAGIAFTFAERATEGDTVVALSDELEAGTPRAGSIVYTQNPNEAAEQEFVTDVRLDDEGRPGAFTMRDYDLRRPGFRLVGEAQKAPAPEDMREQYHYRPGGFLIEATPSGDTPTADDQGAARHDAGEGRRRAQRSLESLRADKRAVTYRTNVLDLWPGRVFSMSDHPHPELDAGRRLLVTGLTLEGAPGEPWTILGRAVFADAPYRPPLRTPRPRARIQSATVTGPAYEEIHTDEFGRVRVQFPWDRGEGTTCWIRVSEGWAGAAYGMMALPRIGQEVLVDFLEGDPEQPVVVGRVFNQIHPAVERLPEHQTRSAWKSDTSPGSSGFNEILYEDKKGSELVYAQAERDARRLVKHDDTSTVVRDRRKLVASNELETTARNRVQETRRDWVELTYGDRTTAVDGTRRDRVDRRAVERIEADQAEWVGKDRHAITAGVRREMVEHDGHLYIGKSRQESVGGTDSLSVHGSILESVGSYSVDASGPRGWIHHMAGGPHGGQIVVESATEVTYKAGSNFIKVDGGGVTIVGSEVVINEGGSPGNLPGAGPRLPGPPEIALVAEPPPPRQPTPNDPVVTYELVMVDEAESPLAGLDVAVTTPAGTTTETTDRNGRIQVQGPPESASAYVKSPEQIAGILAGKEKQKRRTQPLPEGDPWHVRTPTDLADTLVLPKGKPQKLMIVTRTDLAHYAYASSWSGHRLTESGPYVAEKGDPLRMQMQSDATAAQAVVVARATTQPGAATGTERSTEALPGAPGETPEAEPEWLRTVVDSLHDALFTKRFDVAFAILSSIPLDPPRPPLPAMPPADAEKAAYDAALAQLAGQGIVPVPYVEDPNQP